MTLEAVCCFHLFNYKPPGQLPLSKRTLKRLEWHPVNKSQIYYTRIWVYDGRNNMTLHLASWSKRNEILPWYIQRIIRGSGQSFLTNTLARTGINRGIGCGSRHSHGHRTGVHIRAEQKALRKRLRKSPQKKPAKSLVKKPQKRGLTGFKNVCETIPSPQRLPRQN